MVNFWQSLIKGLFPFSPSKPTEQEDRRLEKNITEPDFIDYDGMGNQGRFVKKSEKKRKSKR